MLSTVHSGSREMRQVRRRWKVTFVALVSALLVMSAVTPALAAPVTPIVSTTASASFDRTYLWDISKSVDAATKDTNSSVQADFDYTVNAIPGEYQDSAWEVKGVVTVENPGTEPLTVDVTQTLNVAGGAVCTVTNGVGVTIPGAGAEKTFPYVCSFTSEPAYYGNGTTTVTWAGGSLSANSAVNFALDQEIDKAVDVVDDKTDPANPVVLGQATWNADKLPLPFQYTLTLEGTVGQCVDFTNTAWINADNADPSAEQIGVC